jgi:hypothetical protein
MRNIAISMASKNLFRLKQRANYSPVAQLPSLGSFKRMEREKKRRHLTISTDLVHLAPCMRLDTDSLKFQAPLSIRFLYALNEDPNISQTFVVTRHMFPKKFKPFKGLSPV